MYALAAACHPLTCPPPRWHPHSPPLTVAFRVYDADDDGFVTRADLLRQLQQTNRRGLSAGQLEEIVSSTVRCSRRHCWPAAAVGRGMPLAPAGQQRWLVLRGLSVSAGVQTYATTPRSASLNRWPPLTPTATASCATRSFARCCATGPRSRHSSSEPPEWAPMCVLPPPVTFLLCAPCSAPHVLLAPQLLLTALPAALPAHLSTPSPPTAP